MMACIAFQEEDVPGAIWLVVRSWEPLNRISPFLHTNLNTVCRKPSRTNEKNGPRGREFSAVRWSEDGVCVSASLYEASLGRNGGLLRRTRFIGRLCLTYAVCNDTALVSAYYTRPLRAFACPLRSGTGRSWSHAPTKAVGGEPWCEGEHGITCVRAALHVSKVAQMSEWRAAKSRTLASMRPTSACRGALWQICCGMGGGGIHVLL
jgi:hypothetical protein